MKYLSVILLCVIFNGCTFKQQKNNTSFVKNDSILITYYPGHFNSDVARPCEDLAEIQKQHPQNRYAYAIPEEFSNIDIDDDLLDGIILEPMPVELIDTFIVDDAIINKIIRLLDNRVRTTDFSGDARIYIAHFGHTLFE